MSAITCQDFFTDFQVKYQLGSGNSGIVHLVVQNSTQTRFAMKCLKLVSVEGLSSLYSELQVISKINDPSVVKIYYYFNNVPEDILGLEVNLVLQYCESDLGKEIQNHIRDNTNYKTQEIMSFIKDMGRVLYKMQIGNLIHRDLKPENVLIKFEGRKKIYKLCDFGYSVRQNQYAGKFITGTSMYASPRVKKKFDNTDIYIQRIQYVDDMFSFGKTILQMIFHTVRANEQITEQLFKEIQRKHTFELATILRKMLAFNQTKRYDFIKLHQHFKELNVKESQKIQKHSQIIDLERQDSVKINQSTYDYSLDQVPFQKSVFSKKHRHQDLTIYNDSTQICSGIDSSYRYSQMNILDLSGKNQTRQPKYCLKQQIYNINKEIYCNFKIQDFLLFGLRGAIAVLPTNNLKQNQNLFVIQLPSIKQQKQLIAIIDFKIIGDDLYVFGTCNHVFKYNFIEFLNKLRLSTKNISKEPGPIRSKLQSSFYKRKSQPIFTKMNLINNDFDCSMSFYHEQLSCVYFKQNQQKSKESLFIGTINGSIATSDSVYYANLEKVSIMNIKASRNFIVYSTAEGIVKKIPREYFNLANECLKIDTKSINILKYDVGAPVIYSNFIDASEIGHSQLQEQDESLIPYLRLITYTGNLIILNKTMQCIQTTVISRFPLIACCESLYEWRIKNQKKMFSQQKSQSIQSSLCEFPNIYTIDDDGVIFNITSKKRVLSTKLNHISTLIIDEQCIAVSTLDGKINYFYKKQSQNFCLSKNTIYPCPSNPFDNSAGDTVRKYKTKEPTNLSFQSHCSQWDYQSSYVANQNNRPPGFKQFFMH